MEETLRVKIDLVTQTPQGSCKLVLIETGPWNDEEKKQNLHHLRQRISDCVTAVINGVVAERYPPTTGKPIIIQVDSYDTPRWDVEALVAGLQNVVNTTPEIQQQLQSGRFTSSILLVHRWTDVSAELAKREAEKKWRFWRWLKR